MAEKYDPYKASRESTRLAIEVLSLSERTRAQAESISFEKQAHADNLLISIAQLALAQDAHDLSIEQFGLQQQDFLYGMGLDLIGMRQQQADIGIQIGQTGIQIEETRGKIGDYETYLSNFGAYEQYQKDIATQQGEAQFGGLLANFEGANVLAAARGQSTGGTSAGAMIGKTRKDLASFAGEDLEFNFTGGGLFAQGYQQMVNDLNTQEESATRQLDIYSRSLATLYGAKSSLETSSGEFGEEITGLEEDISIYEESIL